MTALGRCLAGQQRKQALKETKCALETLSGSSGHMDGELQARILTILPWKPILFNIRGFCKEPFLPPHARKRQEKACQPKETHSEMARPKDSMCESSTTKEGRVNYQTHT